MSKRVMTAVIGFPILAVLVVLGGIYLQAGLALISLVGMNEVYMAISKKNLSVHLVGYAFGVTYLISINRALFSSFFMIDAVVMIVLMIFLVANHTKITIIDCAVTLFGFYYVPFMLSNVYLVREFTAYGRYFVWLIFISAWATDTGAYFVGKSFGRHKLAPVLSPKKTVEGSLGGVAVATLIATVYGLIISRMFYIKDFNVVLFCAVIGLAGSVLAQLGDLTASAIKRQTGIKDYGSIFPGHGGVLDRFDSVLFTAPAVYLVMRFLFVLPMLKR